VTSSLFVTASFVGDVVVVRDVVVVVTALA
jgi:hypothetical protein